MKTEIIDWDLALRLAGNNREIADELLGMLTATLADDIKKIRALYEIYDVKELSAHAHRLHGATAYCGTFRLKTAVAELEKALKQNKMDDLPMLLENLEKESQLLMEVMEKQK